jgi:hypothetical protein
MIVYGISRIRDIYLGKTKEDVLVSAKSLVNGFQEYDGLEIEELIEMAVNDELEFDLVEMQGRFPCEDLSKEALIDLYIEQWPE